LPACLSAFLSPIPFIICSWSFVSGCSFLSELLG
jgi:hypothetical protein